MTFISHRQLPLLLVLSFFSSTTLRATAQQPETPEKVASVEGLTEYKFKNGARLILFPDPSASTVTVNMTVFVGSRHEGYGETGMAHLLEHMVFKGSKNFPNIDKSLKGADFNGTTSLDRTNYYETLPASDANLKLMIDLESDRLVHSFINREDLVKEFKVVRNEFEQNENEPMVILSQRINAVAFEWHNYGKSTIGNRSDIERVPIERLQAFYKKYYQPDNALLTIAGKFDEAKALEYVAKTFGSIPRPKRVLEDTYTEEPAQDGERTVVLRRVGKVAVAGALYHVPAATHPDIAAVEILGMALADTPGGRLYKGLVKTDKATAVMGETAVLHDPGTLEFSVNVAKDQKPEAVRDAMIAIIEGTAKDPITKDEVDRQVKRYLSRLEQAMSDSKSTAIMLSNWLGAGDWRLMFLHRDRIAKVTADDVNRVAKQYLTASNRTSGVFIPTKEAERTPIPEGPQVAALVKDYVGKKAVAGGEAFDTSPENLDAKVKRFELSNGLKVALLPKKTRGESVYGTFHLNFGNEQSLNGQTTAAGFVGPLMMRGTQKMSRQQIQDTIDKLSSSVHVGTGTGSLSVGLQSKREQLPALMEVIREILREPAFPQAEFDILKRNSRQSIEKGLTDEVALAKNSLQRKLSDHPPTDIRYVPTIPESIERVDKVTRDDVVKVYKEQIGANSGELVLVGDFDPAVVTPLLEKIFAGWTTSVPYERIKNEPNVKTPGGKETIQVNDKEKAVLLGGMQFAMRDDDPAYAAVKLGNHVLGGGGFNSRLMNRLREKEGWSYGTGSMVRVDPRDKNAGFMVYAICNPTVMEQLHAATLEEINKLLKDGVTTEDLSDAKQGYLDEIKVARGDDERLVDMLRSQLHLGRTFKKQADHAKEIAELTPDQVRQALVRTLDPSRLVIIRAGDFTKKDSGPQKK